MIEVGKQAPGFALKDKDGKIHNLASINSKYKIIYFYPRDNTPSCTIEANMFNADLNEYAKLGIVVIGISGGDEQSKTKFCEKHNLQFSLLSDSDYSVSKEYGVYSKKSFMGRTFMGIHRVTFILDSNNKIIKVYEKVKPTIHSAEILKYILSLK